MKPVHPKIQEAKRIIRAQERDRAVIKDLAMQSRVLQIGAKDAAKKIESMAVKIIPAASSLGSPAALSIMEHTQDDSASARDELEMLNAKVGALGRVSAISAAQAYWQELQDAAAAINEFLATMNKWDADIDRLLEAESNKKLAQAEHEMIEELAKNLGISEERAITLFITIGGASAVLQFLDWHSRHPLGADDRQTIQEIFDSVSLTVPQGNDMGPALAKAPYLSMCLAGILSRCSPSIYPEKNVRFFAAAYHLPLPGSEEANGVA